MLPTMESKTTRSYYKQYIENIMEKQFTNKNSSKRFNIENKH